MAISKPNEPGTVTRLGNVKFIAVNCTGCFCALSTKRNVLLSGLKPRTGGSR